MQAVTSFLHLLDPRSKGVPDGNTPLVETNDAAATRPGREIQQSHSLYPTDPSVPKSPASSPGQPRPSTPTTAYNDRKPRRKQPITDDEKRLCGDFNIPADAVYPPSPEQWSHGPPPFMKPRPKPGGANSFKPVNTISDVNPYQGQRRPQTTYGTSDRRNRGTELFEWNHLNEQKIRSPARRAGARSVDDRYQPSKRRKTEGYTESGQEVIQVYDDDEEPMHVRPSRSQDAHSPARVSPSVGSKSHRSLDSGGRPPSWQSRHSKTSGSQRYKSNFLETSKLSDPHRRRSRNSIGSMTTSVPHQKPAKTVSPLDSKFIARGSHQSTPIPVDDDEVAPRQNSSRQSPLEHFSKQRRTLSPDQDELQIQETRSRHFQRYAPNPASQARINPSTSPRRREPADHGPASGDTSRNLRNVFRRSRDTIEDEPQSAAGNTHRTTGTRSKSPPNNVPQANTVARRNVLGNGSPGWPLKYARSYFFNPDGGNLFLKTWPNHVFDIVYHDKNGELKTREKIELAKVNMAWADDHSRIRLTGSRLQDGSLYLFDLEFARNEEFKVFCGFHVAGSTRAQKVYPRTRQYMETLFSRPLDVNDKLGSPDKIDDLEIALLESRTRKVQPDEERPPQRKRLMIDKLTSGDPSISVKRETRSGSGTASATRNEDIIAPSRSTRSTRNTRPVLDTHIEKSKFSVDVGLGKPWDRPLEYSGSGRRRALVNFTDLARLDEEEFLNDSLIDFYMIHLFEQAKIPANKVYFFNTHFYTTLTRGMAGQKSVINHAAVARWTAKEDIFNYDYIVVPINESTHWYLAIICNVSNIDRKVNLDGFGDSLPSTPEPAPEPSVEHAGDGTDPKSVKQEDTLAPPTALNTVEETPISDYGKDVNLFDEEESKINLVDAEAVGPDDHAQTAASENVSARPSSEAETPRMENLSLDDSIPKGIIADSKSSSLPAKRKMKRKSAPLLKKYPLEAPQIIVLDSLGGTHPRAVRALKDYILEEGRVRRSMEATITQNPFYVKDNHIPMQENFSDCGVFLLGYVEKFFADPKGFADRLLSRQMDRWTDWPSMEASKMRTDMRNILIGLETKRQADRKQAKAGKRSRKARPPPAKTDLPPEPPKELLSPITLQPSAKLEQKSQSPSRPSLAKTEASHSISPRKSSPKVVIVKPSSPQALRSPKRPHDPSMMHDEVDVQGTTEEHVEEQRHNQKRRKVEVDIQTSSVHAPPEKLRASPRLTRMSPQASKKAIPTGVDLPQAFKITPPRGKSSPTAAQPSHDHRGSSTDPITIDDSQETVVVKSPKKLRRPSVESTRKPKQDAIDVKSPKKRPLDLIGEMEMPNTAKKHRSKPSSEEVRRSPAATDQVIRSNDGNEFLGNELLTQLQKHGRTSPRKTEGSPLRENGSAAAGDEKERQVFSEDTVVLESPVEERRSPAIWQEGYVL